MSKQEVGKPYFYSPTEGAGVSPFPYNGGLWQFTSEPPPSLGGTHTYASGEPGFVGSDKDEPAED